MIKLRPRKIIILLSAVCIVSPLLGGSGVWLISYDEAAAKSAAEHKPILMVFSGSDWCKPCILLERQIFSTREFEEFSESRLTLLRVDFPRKKKNDLSESQLAHNERLAEKYNPAGEFPYMALIDSQGRLIRKITYEGENIDEFINKLRNFLPA